MEDGIARSNCRSLPAKRLPRNSDPRLDGGLIHLDTDSPSLRTQILQPATEAGPATNFPARNIEVRLAVLRFGDRSDKRPSDPNVQRQVVV